MTILKHSFSVKLQGVPKNAPIKKQKWPNMVGLSTFQSGPKGSKMVNLDVFDHSGPFWAHLDTFGPFQTKINLLPHKDKVGRFGRGVFEQKIIFV